MRPSKDLRILQRNGLGRVMRLDGYMRFWLPTAGRQHGRLTDEAVAFVVIELDNLWAGVARSLFLSAAFCARDGSGKRVQLSKVGEARSAQEALDHAIRRAGRARHRRPPGGSWKAYDEPTWWKARTLLEVLDEIGASNYNTVSVAMNLAAGTFPHLHSFRNFYAHRSKGTREALVPGLRRLRFPTTYTATRALTSPATLRRGRRPQPLILDWLNDIRNTIESLV